MQFNIGMYKTLEVKIVVDARAVPDFRLTLKEPRSQLLIYINAPSEIYDAVERIRSMMTPHTFLNVFFNWSNAQKLRNLKIKNVLRNHFMKPIDDGRRIDKLVRAISSHLQVPFHKISIEGMLTPAHRETIRFVRSILGTDIDNMKCLKLAHEAYIKFSK